MNISVTISVTILCIISSVMSSNNVPVIIWSTANDNFNLEHASPFKKLTTTEFNEALQETLSKSNVPAVVVFVEESLSIEDFNIRENGNTKFAYPALKTVLEEREGRSSKFIPYVNNPVKVFKVLMNNQHLSVTARPKVVVEIVELDGLEEGQSKVKSMLKHDEIIRKKCVEMQTRYPSAMCVLTANRPSWTEPSESLSNRKLLESSTEETTSSPTATPEPPSNVSYFLLYSQEVGLIYSATPIKLYNSTSNVTYFLKNHAPETHDQKGNIYNLVVKFYDDLPDDKKLTYWSLGFKFRNTNLTWSMDAIEISKLGMTKLLLNETNNPIRDISLGLSFHSPSTTTFKNPINSSTTNESIVITFYGFQMQFMPGAKEKKFGPADDTVYFFTIPILSGLFVCSIFITIVLIGLSMIWDIKTMDQFDDPKGKTITINATE